MQTSSEHTERHIRTMYAGSQVLHLRRCSAGVSLADRRLRQLQHRLGCLRSVLTSGVLGVISI